MIHIAAKEFHFVREIVIQPKNHGIIFQAFGNGGSKPFGVEAVAHIWVISERHHVPQLLNSRADANASRIAQATASRGRSQVVLHAAKGKDAVPQ